MTLTSIRRAIGVGLLLAAACGDDSTGDGGVVPDGGHPDYYACDVPSDCIVATVSCCGTCGAPTRGDAVAIASDEGAAYRAAACGAITGCPACAPLFIDPTLVATCREQRCELVDLLEDEASACESDDDCRVRTPDCCPCGGDTSQGRLIGVSSENAYSELVCDPGQMCPNCEPLYPAQVTTSCSADDHCVAHDTRIDPSLDSGVPDGAACEIDGVIYASGTDGIGDPVSCNTCSCDDGALTACTEAFCPEECPTGTRYGTDCARCGPVDNCEVVRTGCLPECDAPADCTGGGDCVDHACLSRCG